MKPAKPLLHFKQLFLIMTILIVSLGVAITVLLSNQRERIVEDTRSHALEELKLIGASVQFAILKKDHVAIAQFLQQWSEQHSNVVKLRASAPNGYVITDYSRRTPSQSSLQINHNVTRSETLRLGSSL